MGASSERDRFDIQTAQEEQGIIEMLRPVIFDKLV